MPYFHVHLDYETAERVGARGTFQVISITNEEDEDFTHLVDVGTHYPSLDTLQEDIAQKLKIPLEEVDLDEV